MKNQRTLIVASLFLLLCVLQKHARYKAERNESLEKTFNTITPGNKSRLSNESYLIAEQKGSKFSNSQIPVFEFASLDSALTSNVHVVDKFLSHTVANLSSN